MALLAPVLSSLPGIVGGISEIMKYNKASRAAGSGLSARGYIMKQRLGMGLLRAGKRQRGGRIYKARKVRGVRRRGGRIQKKRRAARRGKGFAADFMSNIPLIGPILGGIGRAIGLGMVHKRRMVHHPKLLMLHSRGHGLSPMQAATMKRRLGMGLLAPAGGKMRRSHYRYVKSAKKGGAIKRVLVRKHKVRRARGGYVPYIF